jgi:hypothetical protein
MTQMSKQSLLKAATPIPSGAAAPHGVSRLGTRAWDGPTKALEVAKMAGSAATVKQQSPAATEVVKASVAVGEAVQGPPG